MAAISDAPDTFGLNDQQVRFCQEYLKDLNATKAYIRAGYSALGAKENAPRLMSNDAVKACIASFERDCCSAEDITPALILRELRRLATTDTKGMFHENGNLKMPHEWTADQSACVQSLDVVSRNLTAGDGSTDTVLKLRVHDKTKALDTLAKHLNLLTEKVEHTGGIVIKWQE